MTDWQAMLDADLPWPGGQPGDGLLAELSQALRSPDPVLRDEQALTLLTRWIPELGGEQRRRLGDEMAARFTGQEIQARSVAALVLAAIVEHGDFDPSWLAAFTAWYPAETDLRGHDPVLGWLHAVAHGADLLGTFGGSRLVDPAPLLDLAAARLLASTSYVFACQEDDRLGYAIAQVLTREELSPDQSVDWLGPVSADFAAGQPGPVPPHASNTMRTLRVLYLLADRGVRPGWAGGEPVALRHRDLLRQRIADVLALVAPFTG